MSYGATAWVISKPVLDADPAALDRFLDPLVALRLQLKGDLAATGPHDAAVQQDVHVVGRDVVEDALVVGDYDDRLVGGTKPVHALGDDPQGVDIQPGVG